MNNDASRDKVESRVRQTPKSIATHARILEAAIRCFQEIGYHRTTTSEIAKQARVTRGAVQYYFPTTPSVLHGTVDHITHRVITEFETIARKQPTQGGEALEQGIDALWNAAHHPLLVVWKELDAAARTDPELRPIMEAAKQEFARRWEEAAKSIYGSFLEADPVKFEMGHHLTWQFLQALAVLPAADPAQAPALKQRLLAEFKRLIQNYWGMPASP